MKLTVKKWMLPLALHGTMLVVVAAGIIMTSHAKSPPEEDLSDNNVCLDCHIDEEHVGMLEVPGPNVHNAADGTLISEAHAELACVDCHVDIEEIPHREEIKRTVDCLMCHASKPE
ncbi:MAG: hypothetical protein HKN59_04650 [Gammaproteobacteria bacterium]|nr:hypothetical protein [Gammaproteobacteria bacterium]